LAVIPLIIIIPALPSSEGLSNFRGTEALSMAATVAIWHKPSRAEVSAGIAWSTRRVHRYRGILFLTGNHILIISLTIFADLNEPCASAV